MELRQYLDSLYLKYNRREYISPDPLECVLQYADPADREAAGLFAACIAFGSVKQILGSLRPVFRAMPHPREDILRRSHSHWERQFRGWRHRFVSDVDLLRLISGIRRALGLHGSLEKCFASALSDADETIIPALQSFVGELRAPHPGLRNYLLPSPADGSACKRLNLYLRWMVRCDAVDPGVWTSVPASKLVIPLDTHMHRVARELRLTSRRQADLKTALEITGRFRQISPEDPVRYDFALTRPGIRGD